MDNMRKPLQFEEPRIDIKAVLVFIVTFFATIATIVSITHFFFGGIKPEIIQFFKEIIG